MGMDVYGKNAVNETGEYFRQSMWGWHPIADYLTTTFPELTKDCQHWHSNDGDGLDGEASRALAAAVRAAFEDGKVADYVAVRDQMLNDLPDEPCEYCEATGTRRDAVGVSMGMVEKAWCNGCDGKGSKRPFAISYSLTVESVMEFADFLAACGGFEIN